MLVGVILLSAAVALLALPAPQRILTLEDKDFSLVGGYKVSKPFSVARGEVLSGDFAVYYIADGKVARWYRSAGALASPDLGTGGHSLPVAADRGGLYVVYLLWEYLEGDFSKTVWLVHGTLTITTPLAYLYYQGGLALAGIAAIASTRLFERSAPGAGAGRAREDPYVPFYANRKS